MSSSVRGARPRSTAEWSIVDLAVWTKAELPEVAEFNVERSRCSSLADQAYLEGRREELGEQGHDMDPHRPQSILTNSITPNAWRLA